LIGLAERPTVGGRGQASGAPRCVNAPWRATHSKRHGPAERRLSLACPEVPADPGERMANSHTYLRLAGIWLAAAALLLLLVLALHGPLHPDLQVQMSRIAESASRWAVVHWIAAASLSSFSIAALLMLLSGSRLTSSGATISAWAVVLLGALWTLTTAVAEATVIAHLAASGDRAQFEAWWSFAEGNGSGIAFFALGVAVVAWNEVTSEQRLLPKWSAAAGSAVALASFAGWALGVWFDIVPANLMWVLASALMSLWLVWLGLALAGASPGLPDRPAKADRTAGRAKERAT
jgi:hypothetical protein